MLYRIIASNTLSEQTGPLYSGQVGRAFLSTNRADFSVFGKNPIFFRVHDDTEAKTLSADDILDAFQHRGRCGNDVFPVGKLNFTFYRHDGLIASCNFIYNTRGFSELSELMERFSDNITIIEVCTNSTLCGHVFLYMPNSLCETLSFNEDDAEKVFQREPIMSFCMTTTGHDVLNGILVH